MKRFLLAALISLISLAPALAQSTPKSKPGIVRPPAQTPSLRDLLNAAPNKGQDVPSAPDAQPGFVIELEPGETLGLDMEHLAALEALATKIRNQHVDGDKISSKDLYYAAAK